MDCHLLNWRNLESYCGRNLLTVICELEHGIKLIFTTENDYLGALGLERDCAKYAYLKESGCVSVKTINDVEDFRYTEVSKLQTNILMHYLFNFCAAILLYNW